MEGVDVNGTTNQYGQTALYVAAWNGSVPIVELLLAYGAHPSVCANGGSDAFAVAQSSGHDAVIDLLRAWFEQSNEKDEQTAKVSAETAMMTRLDKVFARETTAASVESQPQPIGPVATTLIPTDADHPGAGSYYIDNALSDEQANTLVALWQNLPIDPSSVASNEKNKKPCSLRSYFCDAHGLLRDSLQHSIQTALSADYGTAFVFAQMRFLHYHKSGLVLAPHVDLFRTDPESRQNSTHTLILYLEDCGEGGETALLQDLHSPDEPEVIVSVVPKRARLLLFPHLCPHMGCEVVDVPKLLLRGEVILT